MPCQIQQSFASFLALGILCKFSHARHPLQVFPLFKPVACYRTPAACFPAFGNFCMLFRAWAWLRVFYVGCNRWDQVTLVFVFWKSSENRTISIAYQVQELNKGAGLGSLCTVPLFYILWGEGLAVQRVEFWDPCRRGRMHFSSFCHSSGFW